MVSVISLASLVVSPSPQAIASTATLACAATTWWQVRGGGSVRVRVMDSRFSPFSIVPAVQCWSTPPAR
jgi:hypothetical protein